MTKAAIALKYQGHHTPIVTATGMAELADDILELAREFKVPIYENQELVALLARLELNEEIPSEVYRLVAEVLAFAYQIKWPEQGARTAQEVL